MKRNIVVPPTKIEEVKKMLNCKLGLRETSRQTGVSFYTVWCISKGKYDSDEPLQQTNKWQNRCFITGFKLN